jgi:hypothetical protein
VIRAPQFAVRCAIKLQRMPLGSPATANCVAFEDLGRLVFRPLACKRRGDRDGAARRHHPEHMLREQHVAGDNDGESLSLRSQPSVWLGGKPGVIPTFNAIPFSSPSRSSQRAAGEITILDQVTEEPIDFILSKAFPARRGACGDGRMTHLHWHLFRWLCNFPT